MALNPLKNSTVRTLSRNHDLVGLKVIHRSCCEQFHVVTIYPLLNYTRRLYHCTQGSLDLLMVMRLVLAEEHRQERQMVGATQSNLGKNFGTFCNDNYKPP